MTPLSDINHRSLVADIRAISGQITALKRLLRATWQVPMASEQRELVRLKQRATELCVKLPGRRAPRGAPSNWNALEYQQRIAERLGPSYSNALEQSA
jgi:hypothetical protein